MTYKFKVYKTTNLIQVNKAKQARKQKKKKTYLNVLYKLHEKSLNIKLEFFLSFILALLGSNLI